MRVTTVEWAMALSMRGRTAAVICFSALICMVVAALFLSRSTRPGQIPKATHTAPLREQKSQPNLNQDGSARVQTSIASLGPQEPAVPVYIPPQLVKTENFYPPIAHGAGGEDIEGTWIVEALITEKGSVKQFRLSKMGVDDLSTLNAIVVSTFRASIPKWTFRPAQCSGTPTEAWYTQALTMRREDDTSKTASEERVFNMTPEMAQPQLLRKVEVELPQDSHRNRVGAVSIFEGVVTNEGLVRDIKVLRPSGDPDIDCRAMKAFAQWRYKPATLHGNPVAVHLTLTLHVDLK